MMHSWLIEWEPSTLSSSSFHSHHLRPSHSRPPLPPLLLPPPPPSSFHTPSFSRHHRPSSPSRPSTTINSQSGQYQIRNMFPTLLGSPRRISRSDSWQLQSIHNAERGLTLVAWKAKYGLADLPSGLRSVFRGPIIGWRRWIWVVNDL